MRIYVCSSCGNRIKAQDVADISKAACPKCKSAGTLREEVVPAAAAAPASGDVDAARELQAGYRKLTGEIQKMIVGQGEVIEQLLTAVFCRGHCLLVGVPGLAKTMLVNTLAQCLSMQFRRIQFTPDLMPSDITGTDIIQEDPHSGRRTFEFRKGPIFANILLADEINRTPPKTQAALLEAMQERKTTVGDKSYPLPSPFFVLATQNPIEQEGTYALPEAQLDRFMFLVHVDYPEHQEEIEVLRRTTTSYDAGVKPVFTGEDILRFQELTRKVPVPDHVYSFAVRLVEATRVRKPTAIEFCNRYLSWGAGPRASQYLVMGAKAHALLNGRFAAATEDVIAITHSVLRHRVVLNFAAEAEGVTVDQVVDKLLESVHPHAGGETPAAKKVLA